MKSPRACSDPERKHVSITKRLILAAAGCYSLFAGFTILHSTGMVGVTRKSGGLGCVCHNPSPADSVVVWIAGPDSARMGTRYLYTISIRGGPAVAGGFDAAAGRGALSISDDSTHLQNGEVTHSSPRIFHGDTVRWSFFYQAPPSGDLDTIFSAGNSVNLDGIPSGDAWNFGSDFVIHVLPDTALGVAEGSGPRSFRLFQNYPNPFKPTTTISYVLPGGHLQVPPGAVRTRALPPGRVSDDESAVAAGDGSLVTLKIYDVLGREVATLVEEARVAGLYYVQWDAAPFPNGTYFYRLQSGRYSDVKKMTLLR